MAHTTHEQIESIIIEWVKSIYSNKTRGTKIANAIASLLSTSPFVGFRLVSFSSSCAVVTTSEQIDNQTCHYEWMINLEEWVDVSCIVDKNGDVQDPNSVLRFDPNML